MLLAASLSPGTPAVALDLDIAPPSASTEAGALRPWRATNRPWPFNGRVTNMWDRPIEVWSDTRGSFVVEAGESTATAEDVDYGNVDGRWYKIGVHHMRVDNDGQVTGYACRAHTAGGPCL